MTTTKEPAWVPDACTLPTAERPLRLTEFDDLFAAALRSQERLSRTDLRWDIDPAAEATARDLTSRDSECCSLVTFTYSPGEEVLRLDVRVSAAHVEVLDALERRAAAGIRP